VAPRVITFRVSNGIFAHRKRIGAAVWVFLWFVDRVTKDVPNGTGEVDGIVLGGSPVSARRIASELQDTPRTVQAHISRLISRGYIRRSDCKLGDASGFIVCKSKKWQRSEDTDTTEKTCAPQDIAPEPLKKVAHPMKKVAGGTQISSRTAQVSSELIKKDRQDRQETKNAAPTSRWTEELDSGLKLFEASMAVAKLHPFFTSPVPTTEEAARQIESVAKRDKLTLSQAADWMRDRVQQYANSPKGRQRGRYAKRSLNWFREACYDENPLTWANGAADGETVFVAADGKRMPGYTPREYRQEVIG
jgi:hypothetical protein